MEHAILKSLVFKVLEKSDEQDTCMPAPGIPSDCMCRFQMLNVIVLPPVTCRTPAALASFRRFGHLIAVLHGAFEWLAELFPAGTASAHSPVYPAKPFRQFAYAQAMQVAVASRFSSAVMSSGFVFAAVNRL